MIKKINAGMAELISSIKIGENNVFSKNSFYFSLYFWFCVYIKLYLKED